MNPSVDDRLKREEKIEKILNEAAALTALVRERSLEKFAAQLQSAIILTHPPLTNPSMWKKACRFRT